MEIYLPIAEISMNPIPLLLLGAVVGIISGLFGVGGGFIMTPLLIFIGVPPAVAVGTQANQIVGASVSGISGYWRRRHIDFKMAAVLLGGSLIGSILGVWIFSFLRQIGQVDLVISILYIVVLGSIGGMMLVESVSVILKDRSGVKPRRKLHRHNWLHGLPFKLRFPRSRLYVSAVVPFAIGFLGGLLVSILGVGGSFFMIPAMIYLLEMPPSMVPGTSLVSVLITTGVATLIHSYTTHTVDIVLAVFLLIGGGIGAQIGTRFSTRIRGEQSRALLAAVILIVALKLLIGLVIRPDNLYSLIIDG
ncbi:MAG: sulfite exporter TauE/SafE family protein [Candidatus Pacebacteria bacterium]|nr:sulfite exporter TauE/SafE family protein [Candidatus Paceibacterota bacterium]